MKAQNAVYRRSDRMVRLLLIRHGETDWNAAARFQGHSDVPLNIHGRQQAKALAHGFAREAIHALYASDLCRAWETAQSIATMTGSSAVAEPRLREIAFGDWEGLTYGEIVRRDPDALRDWQADPYQIAPPGGETLTQVANRVRGAYENLLEHHAGETVVWVAHGGPIRVLLCQVLGLPLRDHWKLMVDPGSRSELRIYTQGAILARLNDTHHFSEANDDGSCTHGPRQ